MAESLLTNLIKKRGGIKSSLTRFFNSLQQGEDNTTKIQARLENAIQLLQKFEEIQDQIEELDVETTKEEHEHVRTQFEEDYYEVIAQAKDKINSRTNNLLNTNNPINEVHNRSSSEMSHTASNSTQPRPTNVKLPTLTLPIFEGQYNQWHLFKDSFVSMIDSNNDLSDIQKLQYLRSALRKEALQVVQGLLTSAENYSIAWQALKDRYENKKLIVNTHIKALFEISPIIRENPTFLRTFVDNIRTHIKSLQALGEPVSHWDTMLIYLIAQNINFHLRRDWELHVSSLESGVTDFKPTVENLLTFLSGRCQTLELIDKQKTQCKPYMNDQKKPERSVLLSQYSRDPCPICQHPHAIYRCEQFLKLTIPDRLQEVQKLKLCVNCFKPNHSSRDCLSSFCRKCHKPHNTLVHLEESRRAAVASTVEETQEIQDIQDIPSIATHCTQRGVTQTILSTVKLKVYDKEGNTHDCRALLDTGSQCNFITQNLCNKLKLPLKDIHVPISGIGQEITNSQKSTCIKIESFHNKFTATLQCLVLRHITGKLPQVTINPANLNIPNGINLADPDFYKSDTIDMLIGAELVWNLMCVGQIHLAKNQPILQKTKFGWVIAGSLLIPATASNLVVNCHTAQNFDLQNQLAKFWEMEEVSSSRKLSQEEATCENHFNNNFRRELDGRFIVKIPMKKHEKELGESYSQAKRQFFSLERKLQFRPNLKKLYTEFMADYEAMGHMKKLITRHDEATISYYMPHHGVLREDSLTTKLRVVFNASSKTTSELSLNDIQMVGPVIQQELLSILLRFRKHVYVIAADIAKMYRQVLIDPEQRALQRILWRASPMDPLQIYELSTVTYGQAASSFLAIRCLLQLAKECKISHPEIAKIIENDFYVDDLLTGADSIEDAIRICNQVTAILKRGCFDLRKFYSNDPRVLRDISESADSSTVIRFGENETAKTLGLTWLPSSDNLKYLINLQPQYSKFTKRTMLSDIAHIFDPLGLLSPCLITAKVMLQRLWLEKLSWDDPLPEKLNEAWSQYRSELPALRDLSINRRIVCSDPQTIELHGFADASESAFGGCLFVRSTNANGNIFVHLLCSKTKVAPLKTVTLPRLELSGALILARLADSAIKALEIEFDNIYLWSDSTIVLGWLRTPPNKLKTFVSSRVSEIQELTSNAKWRHVPGKDNPADILSRGVKPSKLKETNIWWLGPPWLHHSESHWPTKEKEIQNLPDLRKTMETLTAVTPTHDMFHFERFSSLTYAQRAVAYVFRFINNCKYKEERKSGSLSVTELDQALNHLIKTAQQESFSTEISLLENGKDLKPNSRLLNLNPFLDSNNILRVGGRLENSEFPYARKHPILMCSKHPLTKLIFRAEHKRLLHAGPQLLLSSVRQKFWPIHGRCLAKGIVRQCIKCFRHNAKPLDVIMGNLPTQRLQPRAPFAISGVDYAGPYLLKDRKGRGCKIEKCYISLFICFISKAVHLELVTSLTKDAFIMTLRRFCSRRGKPERIFSDNGTNFVSAHSELKDLGKFLRNHSTELSDSFANESIDWKFIPPQAPHFGGLWEAGVKSMKHHLKRVLNKTPLTFEEFYTLLVQVEAILNSRPISPLSSCHTDLLPLTPGHFLIGRPLTSIPSPDLCHVPTNRLSTYQHLQQMWHHIWTRWSKEYVNELQVRKKWKTTKGQLQIGDLVIIKEDNSPPLCWQLGRVVAIHPGADGIARVASLKTARGVIKRAYSKICPIPVESEDVSARVISVLKP